MNLYRRRTFQASVVLSLVCILGFTAAAQRRKAHKLRATAVLELTTDPVGVVTARLIPVTVLDEGRFNDAGRYKATPQPMALDSGVVYEAQKSGQAVGFVTVGKATKQSSWTALGKWQPVSATTKASPTPTPTVATGDERPVLRRGGSPTSATQQDTSASSPSSSGSGSPPTPSSSPAATSPSPTPSPSPSDSAVVDDPDRPVLRRRGDAKSEIPDEQPQAKPKPSPSPGNAVPSSKLPVPSPGTQTLVAVSDNEPGDPRSYQFVWKKGEQAEMEAKLKRLALAQLPRENAQYTEQSLTNLVIRSFDLDLSNDAVMVLSAEIPGSYLAPGTKTTPGKFVSRYITLIARVDFNGIPQRLAVSITDSSRLDVAPRLELIDAVDVDGDGLAELLFRQTSFYEKSFIVYGVGRSSVTKVFEGAAQPLK
jgi:hypothetical protein